MTQSTMEIGFDLEEALSDYVTAEIDYRNSDYEYRDTNPKNDASTKFAEVLSAFIDSRVRDILKGV